MPSGIVISAFRSGIRTHLGIQDVSEMPDSDCDLFTNRSLWELQNNLKWKEVEGESGTVVLSATTRELVYPLPYEAITGVFLQDPDTNIYEQLKRTSFEGIYEGRDTDADAEGQPKEYFSGGDQQGYVADPALGGNTISRIVFDKAADVDYNLNIRFHRKLTDLSDAYTMAPFPAAAHEIILYGAVQRAWLSLGDYNRANAIEAVQSKLIAKYVPSEAIQERDSRYAQVRLIGYGRN